MIHMSIQDGTGPMWGAGLPLDPDVWRSVQYEETNWQVEDFAIVDARGQFANGSALENSGQVGRDRLVYRSGRTHRPYSRSSSRRRMPHDAGASLVPAVLIAAERKAQGRTDLAHPC
jgi:hypothetical protein